MIKNLVVVIAILLLFSGLPLHATDNKLSKEPAAQSFMLYQYSEKMGEQLDCFFTIEDKQESDPKKTIYNSYVTVDPNIKTVSALVTKLQKELTSYAIVIDMDNPKIIHLIYTVLTKSKSYPMQRTASMTYSGPLWNLADTLGKQLHTPLITQHTFFENIMVYDDVTNVSFVSTNHSVRDILSNCLPLDHYNRILWVARTEDINGKPRTEVDYQGPRIENDDSALEAK